MSFSFLSASRRRIDVGPLASVKPQLGADLKTWLWSARDVPLRLSDGCNAPPNGSTALRRRSSMTPIRSMIPELSQAHPQKDLEGRFSQNGILPSFPGHSFPSVPADGSSLGANGQPAFTIEPDPCFDDLLTLAATFCGAPVAVLLSPRQTYCWLRGNAESASAELERELSFCARAAALSDGFRVVPDAAADRMLRDDPCVRGEPRICFHACAPLITWDGQYLGAIHVIDYAPRNLSAGQRSALARLSRQAAAHLAVRQQSRELAQAARNEERFRTLVETAPGGFILVDVTGKATYATTSITRLMGYEMSEVIGRNMFSLIHPDDLRTPFEVFAEVICTPGAKGSSEFRCLQKDGSWKWMEAVAQNFLEVPSIQAIACNLWDISARKAAEAALRESEARSRRIIDSNVVGIFFWNLDGRITDANDRFLEMVGYTREDLQAGQVNCVAMTPPEYAGIDELAKEQIAVTGACAPYEKEYIRKNGSRLPIYLGCATLEGDQDHGLCFVIDVMARKRMEGELIRERNLLRTLIDQIPEYIYVKDTASRYLVNNRANVARMGVASTEETIGKTVFDFFPPEIAQYFAEDDRALFLSGEPIIDCERPSVGPGGEQRWLLTTKVPLRDPNGAVTGLVGISRDITERKKAEQSLARERNLFRSILDNLPLCVYAVDRERRFILNNRAHLRLLGLGEDHQTGQKTFADVAPPELADVETQDIKSVIETGAPVLDRERVVVDVHGHRRMHLASKVPLMDSDGKTRGVIGISQDITERQQAQEQIQKLAAFPQFNPNPVFEFSAKGDLTYCNAAAHALTANLGKLHPKEILPPLSRDFVRDTLHSGDAKLRLETQMAGRTISWSFFPIAASRVVHCYAVDQTDRLALEAQLRQAQKMESIGQLAGGVAHDFNNILTVIQGHAALLLEETTPSQLAESAQQIAESAQRAANLTRQLLTFSRRQVLQPRNLDLNEVVCAITKMLRRMLGEDVALNVRYASNLPPIHADPGMIEQVLMNLAVNARDAMPKGGRLDIGLKTRVVDDATAQSLADARPGEFVVLSVRDTGCGIGPEILERIFEPFFTTKETGHGTGLGLATVYGIVKQHEGWIQVDSKVGQGTHFEIFLPVSVRPGRMPALAANQKARGGSECILLVEDEEPVRELVRCVLENYGYTVIEAASGQRAFDVWQQHGPRVDMLLTDIVMPDGVTGCDLADALKQQKPGLRVLFSSGYSSDSVGKDFILSEGINFLQKPYNPQTLAETVRDCLDR